MLKKILLWAILATLVLVPFFLFEEDIARFAETSLAAARGNILFSALVLFLFLASDIFLPVPSCLVSTACGGVLGVYFGFLVSFSAMTVSSIIGYVIGRFFASFARRISRASILEMGNGSLSSKPIFLLAMRPVPVLAECSIVYAGIRRYSATQCAFWTTLGNIVVSAVYAGIGAFGVARDSVLPAFLATAIFSGLAFILGRVANFRRLSRI